jgi:hypothetical protein
VKKKRGYPPLHYLGIKNLFLLYTGYSPSLNSGPVEQHWESADFFPILTYKSKSQNEPVDTFFTEFVFLAQAIIDDSGSLKYITKTTEGLPANPKDWQIYLEQLFFGNKPILNLYEKPIKQNLLAIRDASLTNPLGKMIAIDIWIALPYPHDTIFPTDETRAAEVINWIDSFLTMWKRNRFPSHVHLRGFYWHGEAIYTSPPMNDLHVLTQVNDYIHLIKDDQFDSLKAIWIPYQGAKDWDKWSAAHFDLAFLQPGYYFRPELSLDTAARSAYVINEGIEMEFDLRVSERADFRSRFIAYLDKGAAGGGKFLRRFSPYMGTALAWYPGGWWYYDHVTRGFSLNKLYEKGDPLYDSIYQFVKGTYVPGSGR